MNTIYRIIRNYIDNENQEQLGIDDTLRALGNVMLEEFNKNGFYSIGKEIDCKTRTITFVWYQESAKVDRYGWHTRERIVLFSVKVSLKKGSNKYSYWGGNCQYYTIKNVEPYSAQYDCDPFNHTINEVIDLVRIGRQETRKREEKAKELAKNKSLQVLNDNGFNSMVDFSAKVTELFSVLKDFDYSARRDAVKQLNDDLYKKFGYCFTIKA